MVTSNQNKENSNTRLKQEQLLKSIVSQKEKVVQDQKTTIKRERELSQKLREAIKKYNLKALQLTQQQQLLHLAAAAQARQ
jgi:hypothetical protein